MCGRYLLALEPETFSAAFEVEISSRLRELGARYNIAPTQDVPIVRGTAAGGRELVLARWGLIPGWAKDAEIGNRMINARAETLTEKPAFRAAYRARRCVVPSSGFYEWQRRGGRTKQPYLVRRGDGRPMGYAGLWESWSDPESGEVVVSFTIVTCAPNELMAELHDRMPVILAPEDYGRWLDPAAPEADALLRPCPSEWLETLPVSTRVNSPRNDDAELLRPEQIAPPVQGTLL